MKRYRLILVHFSPLELYPPVQNLLSELANNQVEVLVLTSANQRFEVPAYLPESDLIKVMRIGKLIRKGSAIMRAINYLKFYAVSFWNLIIYRPESILYFETLSSLAPCIYKWCFGSRVKLLVHYHEYTSPEEYQALALENFMHQIEIKLYHRFDWISHTNEQRMGLFEMDLAANRVIPAKIKNILPNYPPLAWKKTYVKPYSQPLRVVYVGALSLTSMYTKEFVEWVMQKQGAVTIDFYAYNFAADAKVYIQEINSPWVRIHKGLTYRDLPTILSNFDIGIILYRGIIKNHVFSVSNKLFEYITCGLDVWFPKAILGSLGYVTNEGRPAVRALDFDNLKHLEVNELISIDGKYNAFSFSSESVLQPLIDKILKND